MADIAELGYKVDSKDLDRGERALDSQVKAAGRAEKATEKLERQWKKLGKEIGIGIAAIGGIGVAVFGRYIKNTIEAERVQAQLQQRIKSTGGAAGLSAIELNKMADSLQAATTFDDESITEAQSMLLTFTKIGREEFPRATEAVLDMATALNTDLKSAALQVGKALNDPVLGVTALSRAGVQFSDAQKKVIKDLTETGRQAEAQEVILRELETQMGGSARAARDTLGGALQALKNNFDNLLEGESGGLNGTRDAIEDLNKLLTDPELKNGVDTLASGLISIANAAIKAAGMLGNFIGSYNQFLANRGFLPTSEDRNMEQLQAREKKLQAAIERAKNWPVIFGKDTAAKLGDELKQVEQQMAGFAFRNVAGGINSTERRPGEFVPTATGGKDKKEKKNKDAEREARRIAEALRDMTAAQREWQSELEGTGNPILDSYAQRLDEIRESAEEYSGLNVPQEKVAAFTAEMQRLATAIKDKELAEFQREFNLETQEMAANLSGTSAAAIQYERALYDLNEQQKQNLITQEQYDQRLAALNQKRHSEATGLLSDLQFELELMKMTNAERATAIQLRGMDAESVRLYGDEIAKVNQKIEEQMRTVETIDAVRDSFKGFMNDVAQGVDVWDALKNAAGSFLDKLFEISLQSVTDSLFGQQGQSGGGMWGDLIGSFFSGGKALGGDVRGDRVYQVGERNRPELLNMGGRQFMIPGDRGKVEPIRSAGGAVGGNTYNISVGVRGKADRDTRLQIAGQVRRELVQSERNK